MNIAVNLRVLCAHADRYINSLPFLKHRGKKRISTPLVKRDASGAEHKVLIESLSNVKDVGLTRNARRVL